MYWLINEWDIKNIITKFLMTFFRIINQTFPIGTEDSGQRSFLNSVAAAHGQGYEENERKEWRIAVFQIIFQAIQALCRALESFDISLHDPNNIVRLLNSRFFLKIT